nr:2977_t:CDS:1 [Entrophospora candida]
MFPCPRDTIVTNRKWYSPNWTKRGEFTFCEECYHQFIKNTPFNTYIRYDGELPFSVCCFRPNVKQNWFFAISMNNINIFAQHIEPQNAELKILYSSLTYESERQRILITQKGQSCALSLFDGDGYNYQYNGGIYGNRYDAQAAQIDTELRDSMNKMKEIREKMNENLRWK